MSRIHTDYVFSLSPFVLNSPPKNWFATLRHLGGVAWVVPSHFFAFKFSDTQPDHMPSPIQGTLKGNPPCIVAPVM
jgi:hypothetical protein